MDLELDGGVGLEIDENFGDAVSFKVRDFAATSPLQQNTLVAAARSLYYIL